MYLIAKRTIDFITAICALILLAPVLATLVLAIRSLLHGPALFRQVRVGQGGCTFRIAKFRSMTDALDSSGSLLPDEQRLTAFGAFIRRSSLDELPQLWNVLKGDMSLVGPRPLLPEYLPRYSVFQGRRHEVRPGLTGWAQVNGRNSLTWEQKFDLDVWYVDNRTFWLDAQILGLTMLHLLRQDGINRAGHATMSKFLGNEQQNG